MIEVRVREDRRVNARRIDRKALPVEQPQGLQALEQSATCFIDGYAWSVFDIDQIKASLHILEVH